MVLQGSIKNEYDVHVAGFGLWSFIELPFVERCLVEEVLSVVT